MEASTAANSDEEHNRRKYAAFAEAHQFEPIAVKTMGVYGDSIWVILRAIGRYQVEAIEKSRFCQNLAIAVQLGKLVCLKRKVNKKDMTRIIVESI